MATFCALDKSLKANLMVSYIQAFAWIDQPIEPMLMGPVTIGFLSSDPNAVGGTVAVAKTEIGNEFGSFAHLLDTEGNKISFHSVR